MRKVYVYSILQTVFMHAARLTYIEPCFCSLCPSLFFPPSLQWLQVTNRLAAHFFTVVCREDEAGCLIIFCLRWSPLWRGTQPRGELQQRRAPDDEQMYPGSAGSMLHEICSRDISTAYTIFNILLFLIANGWVVCVRERKGDSQVGV